VVSESSVIVLVADGVRPDALAALLDAGELPALAALRAEGESATLVSCFPSISIVGYAPMLLGCHPGRVGLPGLRWFDRTRRIPAALGHARSYVGPQLPRIDRDLEPGIATAFELVPGKSLGMLAGITRGLPRSRRVEAGLVTAWRATSSHLRGDVRAWLALDRDLGARLVARVRRERPRFVFAAFPGCDKASHAAGHHSALLRDALRTVDAVAGALRHDAERDGRWNSMHLWIVSDHGHASVRGHDELAAGIRELGYRALAHPLAVPRGADLAVMVSGNAMAHLYLGLEARQRPFWPALSGRWEPLAEALLARESVDLVALPLAPGRVEIRGRGRGAARLEWSEDRYSYRPSDGDPLGTGEWCGVTGDEVLERTADGPYPDAPVQLAKLCATSRCGDMVVSGAPGWDFRRRFEPVTHVSTHGALHRDQMRVPLLLSRGVARRPTRTADLLPSALRALGMAAPQGLDGRAFL
jgi:hypothetical protein